MGLRVIVGDYTSGGVRTALTALLYLLAIVLFFMGSIALLTVPNILPAAT
jgi:succinate dehydrogenase hydrophobic anchor subunit